MDNSLNIGSNKEIEEALKEFEVKSSADQPKGQPVETQKTEEEYKIGRNVTSATIEKSLKEFEVKSNIEQEQKKSLEVPEVPKSSKMVHFVMKCFGGLITEERTAEYVLLGCALLFFASSIFVFFGGTRMFNKPEQIPPEMMGQMDINGGAINN